jgi:dihydrofolate reductase
MASSRPRGTYEIFAEYWRTVTGANDDLAHALNTLPKYVVSTTLTNPRWAHTTIIRGDVAAELTALKGQPGKTIICVGSSQLAHTLARHRLVERYQLWLHPVVLGRGKRLFDHESPATAFQLIDSMTTPTGLVILSYGPLGPSTVTMNPARDR